MGVSFFQPSATSIQWAKSKTGLRKIIYMADGSKYLFKTLRNYILKNGLHNDPTYDGTTIRLRNPQKKVFLITLWNKFFTY